MAYIRVLGHTQSIRLIKTELKALRVYLLCVRVKRLETVKTQCIREIIVFRLRFFLSAVAPPSIFVTQLFRLFLRKSVPISVIRAYLTVLPRRHSRQIIFVIPPGSNCREILICYLVRPYEIDEKIFAYIDVAVIIRQFVPRTIIPF